MHRKLVSRNLSMFALSNYIKINYSQTQNSLIIHKGFNKGNNGRDGVRVSSLTIDSYDFISPFSPLFWFRLRRCIKYLRQGLATFWNNSKCVKNFQLSSLCLEMWSNTIIRVWYIIWTSMLSMALTDWRLNSRTRTTRIKCNLLHFEIPLQAKSSRFGPKGLRAKKCSKHHRKITQNINHHILHHIISQIILAYWLVLTYDQLADRRIGDVINFFWLSFIIKQVDSMRLFSNRSQNLREGKNSDPIARGK